MKSFLNNHEVRGLRNNNPGNLRRTSSAWQGKIPFSQSKDASFEQFTHLFWGLRALMKNLITQQNRGIDTIRKQITRYAPSNENNTEAYVQFVAKEMGVNPDAKINIITNDIHLLALTKAIVKMENGKASDEIFNSDYEDAFAYLTSGGAEVVINAKKKFCEYCGHALAIVALFFFTYYATVVV